MDKIWTRRNFFFFFSVHLARVFLIYMKINLESSFRFFEFSIMGDIIICQSEKSAMKQLGVSFGLNLHEDDIR